MGSRRQLFFLERLRGSTTWTPDFVNTKLDAATEDGLADALLEREPELDGEEFVHYAGRWIVWSGRRQETRLAVLDMVRSRLDVGELVFAGEPSQEELDRLHSLVGAAMMRAVKAEKLPRSLRDTVVMDGDEPLGRVHLTAEKILERAKLAGRVLPPLPKREPVEPKRRMSGWGSLYRTAAPAGTKEEA